MSLDTIEGARKVLANKGATWVERRDAAAALANFVKEAIDALQSHQEDEDTDVRMAVNRALEDANAGGTGGEARGGSTVSSGLSKGPDYGELVHACAKPGEREVIENDGRFKIIVTLNNSRQQTVYVERFTRKDGLQLVRVYSFCGSPDESMFRWALEANVKLVQSAIGIIEKNGEQHLALIHCFLDGQITKPEMHAAIKEIAHYGDWLENRISGSDEF